jgi:hypothetical protein
MGGTSHEIMDVPNKLSFLSKAYRMFMRSEHVSSHIHICPTSSIRQRVAGDPY